MTKNALCIASRGKKYSRNVKRTASKADKVCTNKCINRKMPIQEQHKLKVINLTKIKRA